jgi:poly-gamma-glutamate system protein
MIKKHQWVFLTITALAILFFFIENYLKSPRKTLYYKEKIEAAQLAASAMEIIKEEMIQNHIPYDSINDPNATYLVGNKFSPITISQNPLTDVLVTLNPNFAAAIVEMFKELRLREGDIIAINTSGSYPGLNIAILSACEILKLKPVITTSATSGSFGANRPEFTWLDMELILTRHGIISHSSQGVSIGGEKDNGEGITPAGRAHLVSKIKECGVPFINTKSLAGNIKERYRIYKDFAKKENRPLRTYVDVGGTLTGFGQMIADTLVKPGINRFPQGQVLSNYGLIQMMAEDRIPVLFLGDIQVLALSMGLSDLAVPQPLPGEDPLFFEERYSVKLAILFLFCVIGLLILYIRIEIYLKRE